MSASPASLQSHQNLAVPPPKFRWGTRVALPAGVLLAFGALFAGSLVSSLTPAVAVQATPVVERPAMKRAVATGNTSQAEVVVQAAGWIEPDPFAVYATTLTDGTVEEVLFREGDAVARGDVLIRLIADDARLALQRASAEVRAAEESWKANIEAQREASVAAASVRETQAALDLAHAELEVEKVLLAEARRIYDRRVNLVREGSISREEHDTAESGAQAQAARVRVAERRIEELEAKLERMKAEEAAARQRLELRTEERRRLELARVALAEAQLRMERLEVKATIDGVVMRRLVAPGSVVMAASENAEMARVAELYDPESLQVRVDVPLADAGKVGVGQPAQVVVEVFPGRIFTGTVSRITNLADIQKNTLEVKVALENPAPELKPDMLARVRFLAAAESEDEEQAPSGLSVFAPVSALQGDMAWVVANFDGEQGIAARRSVTTTGAEEDGWMEIESGLQPGDLVIVSSATELQPEQRVRVTAGGND
ncbi:MAG: hypothetical protein PWP23_3268 [Candidatus Sumerlaeota bacterium]|nr:hypothetical protein [Candidatus Sumerlaeota bacterium]